MDKTFSRALESFNKIDRKMNEALALCEDENHTVCLGELFDLFKELEYARVYKDKLAVRFAHGWAKEWEEENDQEEDNPVPDEPLALTAEVPYSYSFYPAFNRYTAMVYLLGAIVGGLILLTYFSTKH